MRPLNVLFDARFITPQRTGVGYCTEHLLQALARHSNEIRMHTIYHDPIDPSLVDDHAIFTQVRFDDHPAGDIWRNVQIPRIIKERKIDLYHGPAFYSIQRKLKIPQVVTIHDLAVYDQPDTFTKTFAFYFRKIIASACYRATRLITSTQFVADQIRNQFPETSNRISVVPYGVSTEFLNQEDSEITEFKARWTLPDRFILDVATIEPRKNILTLLNAYAIYRRRSSSPLPLIIAGKDGFQASVIKKRSRESDIEGAVRFLGYVSTRDIVRLYHLATMLVFPSLYEGFGLPILEAMASRCPVIASNVTSLPEVCGDAALLVNPMSTTAISAAMLELSENAALRRHYQEKGVLRVANLDWNNVARQTIDVYRSAIERRG